MIITPGLTTWNTIQPAQYYQSFLQTVSVSDLKDFRANPNILTNGKVVLFIWMVEHLTYLTEGSFYMCFSYNIQTFLFILNFYTLTDMRKIYFSFFSLYINILKIHLPKSEKMPPTWLSVQISTKYKGKLIYLDRCHLCTFVLCATVYYLLTAFKVARLLNHKTFTDSLALFMNDPFCGNSPPPPPPPLDAFSH